mmetsp:Transcript_3545/g.4265  ORF Transcript_3545/g.4265 Transcript_3545/m.4265 type:complete len:447 (-) Transcript_3545:1409-2749(-)
MELYLGITVPLLTVICYFWFYLLAKEPAKRDKDGNIMDPVGGNRLKNGIAFGMASIAKLKEQAKFESETLKEVESFHKPENHPFFNESHYYNGADRHNQDRIITRISRRGGGGKKSFIFLLLDLEKYGIFALEEDDVPVDLTVDNPSGLGLSFECIEPMKKWRLKYKGELRKGCVKPSVLKEGKEKFETAHVEFDLLYETDTPLFWYMRDDCAETLAKNLSQEPWGVNFWKVCLKRSNNHGHYEEYGRLTGTISVNGEKTKNYNMGTFRDHSWDIRVWGAMDSLFILLIAFDEPINLFGVDCYYLDLTLVNMPGNTSGVARYSTGYLLGKNKGEIFSMAYGTSILDIPYRTRDDGTREPMATSEVVMYLVPEPNHDHAEAVPVRIKMDGDIRRMQYWPDNGAFEVFEDSMNFQIIDEKHNKTVEGYGTRQSGFRIGEFDTSQGGCG